MQSPEMDFERMRGAVSEARSELQLAIQQLRRAFSVPSTAKAEGLQPAQGASQPFANHGGDVCRSTPQEAPQPCVHGAEAVVPEEEGDGGAARTEAGVYRAAVAESVEIKAEAEASWSMEESGSASPEQFAMLRRCGLNRVEVMGVLKHDMVGSIDPRAPMRIVKFQTFKEHGRIPRSDDKKTLLLSEVPGDAKIVFISHRWLRPWHTEEECLAQGHAWWGKAHPDDAAGTKHKLICEGMEKLAAAKGWNLERVYLWVDFAGVEQDDGELLGAGVASLRGYITLCDALLVPAPASVPKGTPRTVDMVPGGYGDRAWTRLEAMSMYAVSVLKQIEAPEIWVAAGDGASFLERFDYVLKELPSAGKVFDKKDLEYIKGHEEAFLREMRESVRKNGYITKHKGKVTCTVFDPKDANGDLVASGGDDGVIKVVNRQTGTLVWSMPFSETETVRVYSLAFSVDGSMLAGGGGDGTIRVWTFDSGLIPVERGSMKGPSASVTCVAYSPDSRHIASASQDTTVRIWDAATMKEVCSLKGHSEDNPECTCTPITPNRKCTAKGHDGHVFSVAYSPDGKFIASACGEGLSLHSLARSAAIALIPTSCIKIWNLETMEVKGTLKGHSWNVVSIAYSPDGSTIASGSLDKTVRLWDAKTMEHPGTLRGHTGTPESSLQALAAIAAYRVSRFSEQPVDPKVLGESFDNHWDVDGDGVVSLEDLETALGELDTGLSREQVRELHIRLMHIASCEGEGISRDAWVEAVSAALRMRALVSDSSAIVYDPTDPRLMCTFEHSGPVHSVAFSPDGSTLASACSSGTAHGNAGYRTVRLFDPKAMKRILNTRKGHVGTVNSVRAYNLPCGDYSSIAWSPNSEMIASGSDDATVRLFRAAVESGAQEGQDEHRLHVRKRPSTLRSKSRQPTSSLEGTVNSVAWSPDGEFVVSACSNTTMTLWNKSGEVKAIMKGMSPVLSVAYSPDGSQLASAGDHSSTIVRLWDAKTMVHKGILGGHSRLNPECICDHSMSRCKRNAECPVKGHSDSVTCVAFSPDGARIASASADKSVKIWDAVTLKEVGTLKGHSKGNSECTCTTGRGMWDYKADPKCPVNGHSSRVNSVAWSPDGEMIATGGNDGAVRLWSKSGDPRGTLEGHSVAWSPDSETIASVGKTILLWTKSGELKGTLTGSVASWQILDPETKELARKVKEGGYAWSNRAGQYIVTAKDDMVYLYKIDSDEKKHVEPLVCFRSPTKVHAVGCFGTKLVVGCMDAQVLFLEAPLLAAV